MKKLLRKLIKYLANIGAALVIVLAIAVGIFRLMLPQLPEYQEEIKGWASAAIGMQVEFSGMNARWRFSGPELSFFNAELVSPGATESLLSADEVSVGISLFRLIADRELVVDRIMIRDTKIDLRQDETGTWLLQGVPVDDVFSSRDDTAQNGIAVALIGEDIEVEYEHPASGQLVTFTINSMTILRDANQVEFEASIDLAEEFGDSLEISANQVATNSEQDVWRLFVEGNSLDIAGWSRLQPPGLPEIDSGTADISLWLDYAPADIVDTPVTLDVNERGVAIGRHADLQAALTVKVGIANTYAIGQQDDAVAIATPDDRAHGIVKRDRLREDCPGIYLQVVRFNFDAAAVPICANAAAESAYSKAFVACCKTCGFQIGCDIEFRLL